MEMMRDVFSMLLGDCSRLKTQHFTNDHIHRKLSQQPANGSEFSVFI